MRTGASTLSRWFVIAGLVSLAAPFLAGCGGSGGGGGAADLWVRRFSVPNFTGILLDEDLTILFSAEVKESSLNHDSIRIRTGVSGGEAPRGTFVKGVFMVDPERGTRVVIDPDQVAPLQVLQAENEGLVSLIPVTARYDYDPEMKSPLNGNRQVLFDKSTSRGDTVTFAPEIPTEVSMVDTGLKSSATYSVVVPTFPALNTVQNMDGDPCLARYGQVFVSTFTTVPITSPQPFLGGESDVRPRIVNSSPANGAVDMPFDTRISLRFSQPLAPNSISTSNFFLVIASVPGRPQIPVSLFLRQTRLGTVEVIMTPLQDLPVAGPPPADPYVFEVSVNSGVLDLLGQTLVPVTISFSTGGAGGTVQDVVESFDSNAKEDTTLTTANWNARFDYVGQEAGALVASFAPFAGSGADGPFIPNVGVTVVLPTGTSTPIVYNYASVDVGIGATIMASGNFGLVMRCQGDVSIQGRVDVRGSAGDPGGVGSSGSGPANGGAGGAAGVGGWPGGDGAMHVLDASNFHGHSGQGSGGGIAGHSGDQEAEGSPPDRTREAVHREGGGGGAYATGGADSDADWAKLKGSLTPNNGGSGGTPYALIVAPIVGTLTSGFGGSGGGGGGAEDDVGTAGSLGNGVADGWDEGGGGGGGGGGGVQIVAYGNIAIEGEVLADGGAGGSTVNPATGISQGAPGGGGSGGAIFLQANGELSIAAGSSIFARGGPGGQGDGNGNDNPRIGGPGGEGFIRLQDSDGVITIPAGTVEPETASTVSTFIAPLTLESDGYSGWYNQFIATPNYGEPVVDYTLGPGDESNSIFIDVQGSRENVLTPGPDPVDPDSDPLRINTTNWKRIFTNGIYSTGIIDELDNYQYLRFRVEFSIDPSHEFIDTLPKVTRIRIPVSSTPD
jgi:hypothetical protein